MKFYTFLPGFIIVTILAVLLVLNYSLNLDIPVIRNIKSPLIALLIVGFIMCAFGTLAHSMTNIFANGKLDFWVLGMIITGILILVVGVLALFSKTPAFNYLTNDRAFVIIACLIVVKIILSTVRIVRLS